MRDLCVNINHKCLAADRLIYFVEKLYVTTHLLTQTSAHVETKPRACCINVPGCFESLVGLKKLCGFLVRDRNAIIDNINLETSDVWQVIALNVDSSAFIRKFYRVAQQLVDDLLQAKGISLNKLGNGCVYHTDYVLLLFVCLHLVRIYNLIKILPWRYAV